MYDSQKNLIKTVPALPGNFLAYLKHILASGLSCPFKKEIRESIAFLRNIQGCMAQGVLLEGPPETGKNLLACAVSGEEQILFFNISGAEFIDQYVGVSAARVRELFGLAWNKALLGFGYFDGLMAGDKPDLQGRIEALKPHSSVRLPAENIDLLITPAGADLANIANEAAMLTTMWAGHDKAEKEELESAIERILAGSEKKNWGLN